MSSLEISALVEKTHTATKRTIDTLLKNGVIRHLLEVNVSNDHNQTIKVYKLNKRDSLIVVAQLSPKYTARIIDRWQELENNQQHQIPQTFSEALQLASDQAKTIEKQAKSLENKDQLLIATNEASIKAGEILVRNFVKSVDIIDLGEKQFYKWLRERKYITSKNEPYQEFVTRGYFTYKPSKEEINGQFRYTLRVTARGKVWLSNKYLEFLDGE